MFAKRAMGAAFGSWLEMFQDEMRAQRLLSKVAAMWTKKAMGAAFNSWLEMHLDTMRVQRLLLKGMAMWSKRAMGAAFHRWRWQLATPSASARAIDACRGMCTDMWRWQLTAAWLSGIRRFV